MEKKRFKLVFDEVLFEQLKALGAQELTQVILSKMFDKMEALGPRAGKLVDSRLFIYEMKAKRPPLRLYFWHNAATDELYVFEYELKTSEGKQEKTISKIRKKLKSKV